MIVFCECHMIALCECHRNKSIYAIRSTDFQGLKIVQTEKL